MVWFDVHTAQHAMYFVRPREHEDEPVYELVRATRQGTVTLACFSSASDAIARWNDLENTLRQEGWCRVPYPELSPEKNSRWQAATSVGRDGGE